MSAEYHRIFVALDGTEAQKDVARKAVAIASDNHAALRFGHVVDAVPAEASAVDFEELCNTAKEDVSSQIADLLKAAEEDPQIPSVDVAVEAGSINDTLDNLLIAPFDPDLIVCGARGLSNIKYAFVGSVSTHLIRTQECDVLVVK
ncbi:universal stress protein [Hugonella massiliensis]|uniref:universal stress protein n=1 Tax=Hugonella massiliensis TaxID=1720315 RepID=UPI00073E18E9|nr:universal stress protein [Hugonella massiliensis]MDD6730370.1 universal stress protein [Eggerthellaceae bacterium]